MAPYLPIYRIVGAQPVSFELTPDGGAVLKGWDFKKRRILPVLGGGRPQGHQGGVRRGRGQAGPGEVPDLEDQRELRAHAVPRGPARTDRTTSAASSSRA